MPWAILNYPLFFHFQLLVIHFHIRKVRRKWKCSVGSENGNWNIEERERQERNRNANLI